MARTISNDEIIGEVREEELHDVKEGPGGLRHAYNRRLRISFSIRGTVNVGDSIELDGREFIVEHFRNGVVTATHYPAFCKSPEPPNG